MKPVSQVISLITDFGLKDPYVGIMKGVIASINPKAAVIDITHNVRSFDVREAAFTLLASYRWFPPGTVHIVVVDPGVGTARRPLLVVGRNYYFIGPDNGVLSWAAMEDGIESVYVLTNRAFMTREVSYTFHGRDIFAPAAAWLTRGVKPEVLGEPVKPGTLVSLEPLRCEGREGVVGGFVVVVDKFGNVITSCREAPFSPGDRVIVEAEGSEWEAVFARTFGEVPEGQLLVHVNSLGFLEISVNRGSASTMTGLKPGDEVWLRRL